MVRYAGAKLFTVPERTAIARQDSVRTSFKNMREVAAALTGMKLKKAYEYLAAVQEHKRCIPFRVFNGGVGRTGQANEFKTSQGASQSRTKYLQSHAEGVFYSSLWIRALPSLYANSNSPGRWPEKSCKFIIRLLKNAESNADIKHMELDELLIKNISVQQAQKNHRRTYRAHGRINPLNGHPCHIEIILTAPSGTTPRNKGKDENKGLTRIQLARKRVLAIRAPEPEAKEKKGKKA
ncbi:hypothetical protein FRB96_009071 [Tulasnella sp. 330]|nr:hypothetical protein FRB96_009071 [Tulasnella sp. 330]KAG8875278.1 hypothetical protein FRB97_005255 [Tulasnella sp. 331]KAG8881352.1 hypothetical protein FRB98_004396 [Tulasnella sp. 332]